MAVGFVWPAGRERGRRSAPSLPELGVTMWLARVKLRHAVRLRKAAPRGESRKAAEPPRGLTTNIQHRTPNSEITL